ncbi:FapA family protein [Pseudoalteromonas sp. SCSIO 43210]
MFKLAHNGNILLDVSKHAPPSAAFVIEALEMSTFCDCKIDHEAINNFFKNKNTESVLVVATKYDAAIKIEISDDKMLAIGELTLAQGGKQLSLDDAKKHLVKAGIVRGYKQVFLEQLLEKQAELSPGTIVKGTLAKGRLPSDGLATKLVTVVETLKDRLNAPKLKEDGSVDMRDFGKLASVEPGSVLIRQQPATPGKEGFTVVGDILTAKPGENKQLVAGEGTEISKLNPMELVSTIAGVPVEINNGMRVDDIFTISDVNVKSGHIDFEGSVIVTRNIDPGMKINAKGDITILGTVESGELTAGGNITVKQGVIGHQKPEDKSLSCKLVCTGDVHVSHSQYCYIEAANIFIDRQTSHCVMKAKKLLQVGQTDLPKGKIFGGEILDATTLIAGEIGNESGAKMAINLAASGAEITADTDNCFKDLANTDQQLDTLQAALEKADLVKDIDKKNQLIAKIGATQLHYCQQAEQLEKRLSSLDHELHDLLSDANLAVNTVLHSGVEIHIFNKVLKTIRNYPPCNVKLLNNKVEIEFKTH